jgi:hypothetical protein
MKAEEGRRRRGQRKEEEPGHVFTRSIEKQARTDRETEKEEVVVKIPACGF